MARGGVKLLLIIPALALLGARAAAAQTPSTDPAHPLANPQAPAPDCRSDSMRGGNLPCGPSNKTQTSGAPGPQPKSK